MTPQRRITETLLALETHVLWIRETLEKQERRASEIHDALEEHYKSDQEQFEDLTARMNRLLGGLALLGLLISGLGFPWLVGLLGG